MNSASGDNVGSQGGRQMPWLTLVLASIAAALYAFAGPAPDALLFDRSAIASGEVWRLVTGHFVHADPAHLWWNLAAFVPLGLLLECKAACRGWAYAGLFLTGALAVDAWLWFGELDVAVYCGLSGVLNGLFGAVAVLLWRQTGQMLFLVAVLVDLAKIAIEAAEGGALLPTSTWVSVPGVHLAGLAAGLVFALAAIQTSPGALTLAASRRPG
jgi:rhomboid family GlyGly-CTERM serine protease